MTRTPVACALVVAAALGAPAPFPKPDFSEKQKALLESAAAEIALARREREVAERLSVLLTEEQRGDIRRAYASRCAKAAEKIARVHAGLTTLQRKQREVIAIQTAEAWMEGGEPARALRYYNAVIRDSKGRQTRMEALLGARGCLIRLKNPNEADRVTDRIRREIEWLSERERVGWARLLDAVEQCEAALKRQKAGESRRG